MKRLIATFILVLVITSYAPIYGELLSVQMSGGTEKIEYFMEQNILYFSMSQLADLFGDRISWEVIGQTILYQSDSHQSRFFIDSPYMRIEDSVRNLTYPVRLRNGELYLPAETFMPVLNRLRPEKVTWDSHRKTIRVDSDWYNITDLSVSAKANGLLIELFVSDIKDYELFTSEGNWLNITIPDGTVNRRQLLSHSALREA